MFVTSTCIKKVSMLISRSLHMHVINYDKQRVKLLFEKIVKNENIQLTDDAFEMLLQMMNFSCRSIMMHLDKIRLIFNNEVDTCTLKNICSSISYDNLQLFTDSILMEKNIRKALSIMQSILENGYSVIDILETYNDFIRYNHSQFKLSTSLEFHKIISKYIALFHTSFEHERIIYSFTYDLYHYHKNTMDV